jgi:hypothetical protein
LTSEIQVDEIPRASLLGLPGELRNRIWRFALLEDGDITIDVNHHQAPALLRTSRQCRQETAEIFYQENAFLHCIVDLKSEPQPNHWVWALPSKGHFFVYNGGRSWTNFTDWLHLYHAKVISTIPARPNDPQDVFAAILGEVANIVIKAEKLPWANVVGILESLRKVMEIEGDQEFDY